MKIQCHRNLQVSESEILSPRTAYRHGADEPHLDLQRGGRGHVAQALRPFEVRRGRRSGAPGVGAFVRGYMSGRSCMKAGSKSNSLAARS